MLTVVTPQQSDREQQSRRRIAGIDLARALAMLGMLVEHTLQYPSVEPKGVLWAVYGRSGPLFVLLAGVGLSLATRSPGRPLRRAMILARALLLLLVGMALSTRGDSVILQSFALFFLVGACAVGLPRRALAALSGLCLAGGPLFLTVLRRHGDLHGFGTRTDVGFGALHHSLMLLNGLLLEYYPAAIWLGFFFLGMVLGRSDVSSAAAGRRLFSWAACSAVVLFTVGWAGARAFGPGPRYFVLAPPAPYSWSELWTTYGFSNAVGWAVSSAAVALAVTGACIWVIAAAPRLTRVLSPLVCLGAMSLTFYVLHFLYLGTVWLSIKPYLTTTVSYFLASVAFWVVFALLAQEWLERIRRGPLESVVHVGALVLTAPLRIRDRARSRRRQPADGRFTIAFAPSMRRWWFR